MRKPRWRGLPLILCAAAWLFWPPHGWAQPSGPPPPPDQLQQTINRLKAIAQNKDPSPADVAKFGQLLDSVVTQLNKPGDPSPQRKELVDQVNSWLDDSDDEDSGGFRVPLHSPDWKTSFGKGKMMDNRVSVLEKQVASIKQIDAQNAAAANPPPDKPDADSKDKTTDGGKPSPIQDETPVPNKDNSPIAQLFHDQQADQGKQGQGQRALPHAAIKNINLDRYGREARDSSDFKIKSVDDDQRNPGSAKKLGDLKAAAPALSEMAKSWELYSRGDARFKFALDYFAKLGHDLSSVAWDGKGFKFKDGSSADALVFKFYAEVLPKVPDNAGLPGFSAAMGGKPDGLEVYRELLNKIGDKKYAGVFVDVAPPAANDSMKWGASYPSVDSTTHNPFSLSYTNGQLVDPQTLAKFLQEVRNIDSGQPTAGDKDEKAPAKAAAKNKPAAPPESRTVVEMHEAVLAALAAVGAPDEAALAEARRQKKILLSSEIGAAWLKKNEAALNSGGAAVSALIDVMARAGAAGGLSHLQTPDGSWTLDEKKIGGKSFFVENHNEPGQLTRTMYDPQAQTVTTVLYKEVKGGLYESYDPNLGWPKTTGHFQDGRFIEEKVANKDRSGRELAGPQAPGVWVVKGKDEAAVGWTMNSAAFTDIKDPKARAKRIEDLSSWITGRAGGQAEAVANFIEDQFRGDSPAQISFDAKGNVRAETIVNGKPVQQVGRWEDAETLKTQNQGVRGAPPVQGLTIYVRDTDGNYIKAFRYLGRNQGEQIASKVDSNVNSWWSVVMGAKVQDIQVASRLRRTDDGSWVATGLKSEKPGAVVYLGGSIASQLGEGVLTLGKGAVDLVAAAGSLGMYTAIGCDKSQVGIEGNCADFLERAKNNYLNNAVSYKLRGGDGSDTNKLTKSRFDLDANMQVQNVGKESAAADYHMTGAVLQGGVDFLDNALPLAANMEGLRLLNGLGNTGKLASAVIGLRMSYEGGKGFGDSVVALQDAAAAYDKNSPASQARVDDSVRKMTVQVIFLPMLLGGLKDVRGAPESPGMLAELATTEIGEGSGLDAEVQTPGLFKAAAAKVGEIAEPLKIVDDAIPDSLARIPGGKWLARELRMPVSAQNDPAIAESEADSDGSRTKQGDEAGSSNVWPQKNVDGFAAALVRLEAGGDHAGFLELMGKVKNPEILKQVTDRYVELRNAPRAELDAEPLFTKDEIDAFVDNIKEADGSPPPGRKNLLWDSEHNGVGLSSDEELKTGERAAGVRADAKFRGYDAEVQKAVAKAVAGRELAETSFQGEQGDKDDCFSHSMANSSNGVLTLAEVKGVIREAGYDPDNGLLSKEAKIVLPKLEELAAKKGSPFHFEPVDAEDFFRKQQQEGEALAASGQPPPVGYANIRVQGGTHSVIVRGKVWVDGEPLVIITDSHSEQPFAYPIADFSEVLISNKIMLVEPGARAAPLVIADAGEVGSLAQAKPEEPPIKSGIAHGSGAVSVEEINLGKNGQLVIFNKTTRGYSATNSRADPGSGSVILQVKPDGTVNVVGGDDSGLPIGRDQMLEGAKALADRIRSTKGQQAKKLTVYEIDDESDPSSK